MAPTLAMSVTGVQAAGLLGRAAPLAYAIAAVGVALVSFGFVRLASQVASAGSVYAFVGEALGPRAGFFAGWALLGTYIVFPPTSIAAMAVFGEAFLKTTGIDASPAWLPIAVVGWALTALLASRRIKTATRTVLVFELVSVTLIIALLVVIFAKLTFGGAPHGQDLNSDWLHVPAGTGGSMVALAAVFGFLSWAGFESAGSLGEESVDPKRAIPRSIVYAVAFGAVFYVVCIIGQTLGFGTDADGVKAFASSQAPVNDLAKMYVGSGMAAVLDAAAMISALGAALGGVAVGSRMLFAMSRDGRVPRRLSEISESTGTPEIALAVILSLALTGLLVLGLAGDPALDVFFYFATIGVLSLLVMYITTNVAALRLLAREGRMVDVVIPVLGIAFAGYALWKNVSPVPDFPFNLFPYIVAGWLVLGTAIAYVRRAA
jgi:amino acid transporter